MQQPGPELLIQVKKNSCYFVSTGSAPLTEMHKHSRRFMSPPQNFKIHNQTGTCQNAKGDGDGINKNGHMALRNFVCCPNNRGDKVIKLRKFIKNDFTRHRNATTLKNLINFITYFLWFKTDMWRIEPSSSGKPAGDDCLVQPRTVPRKEEIRLCGPKMRNVITGRVCRYSRFKVRA